MRSKVIGAVIEFSGIVQGVGFRPAIYRTAVKHRLKGEVRNTERGVLLRIDGERKQIVDFINDFLNNLPPLAEIHETNIKYQVLFGFKDFSIEGSLEGKNKFTPISPDIATCPECLNELFDPSDRRYRYPFINCTNCGPRFTIIENVPYDRKNTTMKVFKMCEVCAGEYNNPLDRRYHAQPNACPVCGPKLFFGDSEKVVKLAKIGNKVGKIELSENSMEQEGNIKEPECEVGPNAIKIAGKILKEGKIVAIKGLGGFHLAVDPFNEDAVIELRKRKKRPGKPFALMAKDLKTVKKYCDVTAQAEKVLLSYQRPIVLLKRKTPGLIACEVAPDTDYLGMMLPYTPLHHLLMNEGFELLVMTSANLSEEPLAYTDSDAGVRLKGIADFYLTHNREIARPCDDSVVCVIDEDKISTIFPLRRSRGYVPRAIMIETNAQEGENRQILAFGAQEKNTFCLLKGGRAFLSHHIGDLDNPESVEAYERGIEDFSKIFNVIPGILTCDMHPDYTSTRIAEKFSIRKNLPLIRVQHHHAHLASLLAERRAEMSDADACRGSPQQVQVEEQYNTRTGYRDLYDHERGMQREINMRKEKTLTGEAGGIGISEISWPDLEDNRHGQKIGSDWHMSMAEVSKIKVKHPASGDWPIIGIIFDGTGYGIDGAIWGGEFLYGDAVEFERAGHIRYVPMFGGEMCIKELSRMALSWLFVGYGGPDNIPPLPFINEIPPDRLKAYALMYEKKLPAPLTSSCGRLFDAVSAILGLCFKPAYDAQGAILLETYAERYFDRHLKGKAGVERAFPGGHYPYEIKIDGPGGNGSMRGKYPGRRSPGREYPEERPLEEKVPEEENSTLILDFSKTIRGIVEDLLSGKSPGYIAYHFHRTLSDGSVRMCEKIRDRTGCRVVGLSGGVFQNKLLLRMMLEELSLAGFEVLTHRLVPPNDGGISLGQAYVALKRANLI